MSAWTIRIRILLGFSAILIPLAMGAITSSLGCSSINRLAHLSHETTDQDLFMADRIADHLA
ncbi:MAG: hypothetical protein C0506_16710 [Anaerolinea sp.]|nr:hypothetical protein [Anaerolinea sp.]